MNIQQALVYLPQDRWRALAQGHSLPDRTSGVALFADVSGFTPLAETLVRAYGIRRGAEALIQRLDQLFEALIAQLDCCGGTVISFEGDAITCWFDDTHAVTGSTSQSAMTCMVKMEKAMREFTAIQIPGQAAVSLALKVTAAYGPARRFVVGDPGIQRIDTLAGKTLERMAAAESLAKRGEIVVDEVVAQGYPVLEQRVHPDTGACYFVIDQNAPVFADLEPAGPQSLEMTQLCPDDLIRPYVLPAVWERLEAGLGELMAELRPAAALFLRFTGIEYDVDEDAGQKLDTFIRTAQGIMSTYDGTLLQLSIGDKGSYFYAAFGAPVAHEDDMRRAVQAAVDLRTALHLPELGLQPVQIGVSQGVMHTGAFGGSTRRTYGVIGDDVNTSARLMSKAAPGEILVSGRVRNATAEHFVCEPRPPVLLKGKTEPQPVYAITGQQQHRALRLQEPSYALPMIGRLKELAQIEDCLELAAGGAGQVVGITADPGMGKSRLAAEVIRLARRRGFTGFGGACQSASAAYQVWKPIWQAFFALDPDAPLRRQLRNLEGEVDDRAPDRIDALPLLGPLLGLAIPDNDFTASLEPQLRKSALEALLLDCLKAEAQQAAEDEAGILLVLEDVHWIDPASLDLLEAVVRLIAGLPVLVVLVYRPLGLRGALPSLRFQNEPNFSEVTLQELNQEEAIQVIRAKLSQLYPERSGAVSPVLVDRVTSRAQGNPFYLEELLNYVHDRALDLDDPDSILRVDLPASLHSLVLSRIDQFTARQQITLKAASVIGRLFRYTHLSGYYPVLIDSERPLRADLDVLSQFELTPMFTTDPELEYLFKHIVTREVAYESLPYATRAALHAQYADYVEQTEVDKLARPEGASQEPAPLALLELLALHYGLSENLEKQREYFRRAGDAAAQAFANAAAVDYYTRLLLRLDEPDRQEIRLKLAAVHRLTGAWDEAELVLKEGLWAAELSGDRHLLADFRIRMGDLQIKRGAPKKALEWLGQAQAGLNGRPEDRQPLCDALITAGEAHWALGAFDEALAALQEAQDLAGQLNDPARLLRAVGNISLVYDSRADFDTALKLYDQAYDLAIALSDRRGIINSLINIGSIYWEWGEYPRALESFQQAYSVAFEIGSRLQMSIAAGNCGNVYQDFGDFASALACYGHNLDLSLLIGDRPGIAMALWNIATTYQQSGNEALAGEYFDQAVVLGRTMDMPFELCEFLQSRADYLFRQGRLAEARFSNHEARALAESLERVPVVFLCDVLEVALRRGLGEWSAAEGVAALEAMLNTYSEDEQQAALHYEIWKLEPGRDVSRARAAALYITLHEKSALARYRARVQALGAPPLSPAPLPALPEPVAAHPIAPITLKERVKGVLRGL